MRTMVRESPDTDGRARARARLALAGLLALFAVLALPGLAHAATQPAKVGNITITPALAGHPTFGLYHFDVSPASVGESFAYPFSVGPKIGHCVEATTVINSDTGLLLTGADLSLENGDPLNTLGTGLTVGAQQLEWILLDSYKNSPGDATGVEGAAHQSAIWQLTNPSSPTVIHINGSEPGEQAAAARTAQLLAGAQANYASVANTGDLTVDGGADLHTCGGTTRTVTVSGSPFTDATLTLTGVGRFDAGGTTTTVALGATGQAQVLVDSTGPGKIDVTATVQVATMLQADNGGNQDFVYLEFKPVQKQVEIVFNDCQNLQLANTAQPAFSRTYDWTIAKSVDQALVTTSSDAAVFNYTVAVTKSAATDGGWKVTGSISITNPNATSVLGVTIAEQGVDNGGVCALDGSGAIGALASGHSGSVGYTCTYAAAPDPTAGVNTAHVSWTLPSSGTPAVTSGASVTQSFAFGAPTIVHDSVDVADSFDGASLVGIAGGTAITSSATFTYSRSVAVPASACRTYANTATVTATDAPDSTKVSTVSVQACRQAPPVAPASIPTKTTVTLAKRASSPTVEAGGTVGFTITWKNTGKVAAKHVVICDRLPDQLTFVSARGAAFKNGKACWTRASVRRGATLTFRVTARAAADVGNEKLVNVATATASNAKPARATAPVRAHRHARTRPAGVTG